MFTTTTSTTTTTISVSFAISFLTIGEDLNRYTIEEGSVFRVNVGNIVILSGAQDHSGHEAAKKNLHLLDTQDRTRAVQPLAKHLTT